MVLTSGTVSPSDGAEFNDAAWVDVLRAVDKTYAELVAYQEQLEQRNAELDELRRFMASVFASVSDVLIVVNRDCVIEQESGSLERILGARADGAVGRRLMDLVADGSRDELSDAVRRVIDTRQQGTIEADFLTDDGTTPLDISIAPRIGERGKSLGAVLIGRPVGELRRAYSELAESHRALQEAQAHLVRNEKLASLGRLLAGVAHELNNPISFVYANAHALEKYATRLETYFDRVQAGATRAELVGLREDLKLDKGITNLRQAINGARDGAERVRDIVEDLRRLSADGQGEMTRFDLAETVHIAANWVLRGAKSPVEIAFKGQEALFARGRTGHIQQVVMNLIQNAIDAMEGGEEQHLTVTLSSQDKMAVVEIRDTGPGVSAELAQSIFDPFFTTKVVGKGTGLGLSISHKIAEEHGGRLFVCNPDEAGACFRLELPMEADQ